MLYWLCSFSARKARDSRDQRYRARDGRTGDAVSLLARRMDGTDIDDLLLRGVGKTSPQDTNQTEYNQDRSKNFHGLFLSSPNAEHVGNHL